MQAGETTRSAMNAERVDHAPQRLVRLGSRHDIGRGLQLITRLIHALLQLTAEVGGASDDQAAKNSDDQSVFSSRSAAGVLLEITNEIHHVPYPYFTASAVFTVVGPVCAETTGPDYRQQE